MQGRGGGEGAYKRNQETLAQFSLLVFSSCYLEIAESACQYIHGISVKRKERKERGYILRIMTSLFFVIPDGDPPYLGVPYHL